MVHPCALYRFPYSHASEKNRGGKATLPAIRCPCAVPAAGVGCKPTPTINGAMAVPGMKMACMETDMTENGS
jgi:hypothetical protein